MITYVADETKISALLVGKTHKDKREELKAQYVQSILTDSIKAVLIEEVNSILMPLDDRSAGWDVRESERQGRLKGLLKAISLLP